MPMIPTRALAGMSLLIRRRREYRRAPAEQGAVLAMSRPSGSGRTQVHWARTRSRSRRADPRWFPGPLGRDDDPRTNIRGRKGSFATTSQGPLSGQFSGPSPVAERRHRAGHLVAGNERIVRHAPFVIEHRKIRVADAAVRDLDFHFLRPEFARIESRRVLTGLWRR